MDGSGTTDQADSVTLPAGTSTVGQTGDANPLNVTTRLQREGRWSDIEPFRNQMMRDCRAKGLSKAEAQAWTYAELNRLYPPLQNSIETNQPEAERPSGGRVQGLSEIPVDWPDLPDNASLAAEIGWVQANRLRIVEERPSGATVVHLADARTPAPSWAALGWLETSIRSYSKYIDVVAKSLAVVQDEQELVRRERMAIEEIRGLLAEMLQNDEQ